MSSVIPQPPNYVHDFGLRGYHIMSGILPQPDTDSVLRDNDFQNQNQETSLDSLPYYHKDIKSSDEAIKFIKSKPPKMGQFIVRKSSKGKGFLSITVELLDRNIKHINIKMEKDEKGRMTFCLLKEMGKFNSLDSLIEFYKVNPIENIEKVKDVRLLYPLKRIPENLPMRRTEICSNYLAPFNANGNNLSSNNQLIDRQSDLANSGYTYVRNMNIDQSHLLKMNLEKNERCKCGISKLESRLPGNYTIHKVEYPNIGWKLYFQDSENKTTWTLPDHIIQKLEPCHWKNLMKLYSPHLLPPWLLKKRPICTQQDEV